MPGCELLGETPEWEVCGAHMQVLTAPSWDYPLSRAETLGRVILRAEALRKGAQTHVRASREAAALAKKILDERDVMENKLRAAKAESDRAQSEASSLRSMLEVALTQCAPVQKDSSRDALNTVLRNPWGGAPSPIEEESSCSPCASMPLAFPATPPDGGHRPSVQEGATSVRPTPRDLATPRTWRTPQPTPRGVLRGSVAQVVWQEDGRGVLRLAFLRRTTGELQCYGGSGPLDGGPLPLRRGEYLAAITGSAGRAPHIAQWLTLTTSEGQHITIGLAAAASSSEADFSFTAGRDCEVVGLRFEKGGGIAGIVEAELPPSRVSGRVPTPMCSNLAIRACRRSDPGPGPDVAIAA